MDCPALLPHGVEDSSVLHDAKQLVGGGHVVRDRPLAIAEKSVWRPDLADHQVVEPQDLYGAFKFQAFVNPCLTEEHVHGVFLEGDGVVGSDSILKQLLQQCTIYNCYC